MARSTPKRAGREHLPGSRFPSEVLAENIRKRRLLGDLTQEQLAQRMSAFGHEWTAGIVGFVERGDRTVTVDELVGLAVILETSLGDLIDPAGPDHRGEHALDFGGTQVIPADRAAGWVRSRSTARCTWDDDSSPRKLVLRLDDPQEIEDFVISLSGERPTTTETTNKEE